MRSRPASNAGRIGRRRFARSSRSSEALPQWPDRRLLVFCDEDAPRAAPLAALAEAKGHASVGLVIGPEGGFDQREREAILALPRVVRLSLGPRILRADTAAVAALALVQATLGDWAARKPEGG